jgi:uncharacterized 2Fe-2S/4Fe-4S cluster protein (DUF4445 family)
MINKTINENLSDDYPTQVTVFLPQLNKTISASKSTTLLNILNTNKILIYAPCGGNGVCGKCKVLVHGDINELTNEEKKTLPENEIKTGIRLACKTYINTAAEVRLLDTALENHSKEKIKDILQYKTNSRITKKIIIPHKPTLENGLSTLECIIEDQDISKFHIDILQKISTIDISSPVTITLYNNLLLDIDTEDTLSKKYGVAIDLGTTTVACYLIDLNTGHQLAVQSMQNPQAGYGADVISRINYSMESAVNLKNLQNCIVDGISSLIKKTADTAGIEAQYIYECVLVGNTAMNHLFLGFNPKSLSQIPFNPVIKKAVYSSIQNTGLNSINKNAVVSFLPNIGGFVGSDTVGCIIAAELAVQIEKCRVLVDLGTNGEIVLSSPKGKYTCSTAAGPAFEGANISCGMQAFEGAVNSIKIADDISYTTISDKPALGICGSGLIDLIAELIKSELISTTGKIADPENIKNEKINRRIVSKGRIKHIILAHPEETAHNEEIIITQKDIREIQLAKAAIMAGINILLKIAGYKSTDIDEILLAGAFGNFINKENALAISLFPDISLNKVKSLGNAAGEGAKLYLCDRTFTEETVKNHLSEIAHIEISTHPDFQDEFVDNMYF